MRTHNFYGFGDTQLDRILQANLTEDVFFGLVMKDKDACQELINTFLGTNFKVIDVVQQYTMQHGMFRGSRYDVLAIDTNGHRINIEMQQIDTKNQFKRMRYYRGQADTGTGALKQREDFDQLKDFYAIFISRTDFIGAAKQIYTCRKYIESLDGKYKSPIDDGSYEYYVNLKIKGTNDKINRLADLILNSSVENCTKEFSAISKQIKYYKTTSEGVEIMRSEFDERVNILDDKLRKVETELAKADERLQRIKEEKQRAEEEKQRAEEEKQRAEEEKILTAIDLLVDLDIKGEDIENKLCKKFSMTKNEATAWIRRYVESKTKK